MKKYNHILLIIITIFIFNSCTEDTKNSDTFNYVTFESSTFSFGVDPEGSASKEIKVYTANLSSSDRTFNISVVSDETNATGYSVPETVTVPANSNVGTFTVSANGPDIDPAEGNTIVIQFASESGLFIGDPMTILLEQVCPYPEVFLNMTFDSYPEEQSWELYDSNDVLLFEGGPYNGEVAATEKFCLASGSYQLVMYDVYGDGGGAYTLTSDGTVLYSSDGDYGAGEVVPFTLP